MASQFVVFNTGQKMALRAFNFIRTLTKALTYYYINRSQRHLVVAVENNRFGGLILTLRPTYSKVLNNESDALYSARVTDFFTAHLSL